MYKLKEIADKVYYVGVNDRQKALFENMWPLPYGVSYNSYLIVDEKTVLVDTVDVCYSDIFLKKIADALDGRLARREEHGQDGREEGHHDRDAEYQRDIDEPEVQHVERDEGQNEEPVHYHTGHARTHRRKHEAYQRDYKRFGEEYLEHVNASRAHSAQDAYLLALGRYGRRDEVEQHERGEHRKHKTRDEERDLERFQHGSRVACALIKLVRHRIMHDAVLSVFQHIAHLRLGIVRHGYDVIVLFVVGSHVIGNYLVLIYIHVGRDDLEGLHERAVEDEHRIVDVGTRLQIEARDVEGLALSARVLCVYFGGNGVIALFVKFAAPLAPIVLYAFEQNGQVVNGVIVIVIRVARSGEFGIHFVIITSAFEHESETVQRIAARFARGVVHPIGIILIRHNDAIVGVVVVKSVDVRVTVLFNGRYVAVLVEPESA